MTESDTATATAFSPPASDPVVSTSTAAFSPPATDPVIESSNKSPAAFSPPNEDAVAAEVLDHVNAKTPKELADDHEFNPAGVVAQYHAALTPAQIDKLAEAYHSQRQQHMTASDVGRAVKKTPSALKDFVVGAFQLAKRVPSVIGQAGRSAALTPEALAATNAQNLIDRGNLSDEDRARYQGVIDNYNKLKAGLDQSNQAPEVKNQSKDTAEVLAGLESGTTGLAHLVFKDKTDNQKEFNPDTARTRLLNDAAYLEQQKLTGEGKGEFAKSLAMDADTFAKDGVQLDPKVIEQMSSVESPITWIPILAGAKIAALGNGAFQVLNKAGIPIATAATRQAAEKVIAWSGEKIAQAGEKISGSGTSLAKLAGVGHLIHGGGLTGLATAGAVKVGATAVGKTVEGAGKLVANPAVYKPLLDFAGGAAKGSVGGAAFGVPLAALADSPQEAADALVTSAGFGAAGGAAHVGAAKVKQAHFNAVQHVVAAHFASDPAIAPVNDYTLPNAQPALEAQHQSALDALKSSDPYAANLLNRYRAAMAVKGVPSYLLTSEQAAALSPELAGKEGASRVELPTADGKTKEGLVWVLGKDGVPSAGHEVGHFLDNFILTPEEKASLDKVTAGDFQNGFNKHYLESPGLTDAQRKALTPEKLQAELRSEILSGVLNSADFKNVPPTIQAKSLGVASRLLERLGMYEPGVAPGVEAPNVTGFGTKLSPRGHAIATDVVNRWVQDPEVQSALNNISKEPAPTAPANPNAPAPSVTPAHETVLELLKPKVSTDEFKSWTGIKEKIQKGEPLTPSEAQDWGKLDEVAQTIPPEIEAATASPAPTTGEIKPADTTKPVAPIEPGKSAPVPSSEEIKPVENKAPQPSVSKDIPNLRVTREQQNKFENTPERTDIGIQEAEAALKDSSPEQKQIFQTIREALRAPQGQVKPVEIIHSSVEPVEETPGGTRTKRRSEQEEQGTRKEYQKLIIPDGFNVTAKGKVQLRAVSPDKVLANAKQIAANKKAAPFIPYEVKNGSFTEASAKEFNNDLEQYWVNQAAGFKGDGSPLVRPEGHGGFIPSENNQGQVKPIDKAKVDFLNLVQGIAPPKTARVNVEPITQAPIKPVNVRAFELAKANSKEPMKPGVIRDKDINKQTYENYGNQQISEFNPLRKKLDEAGVSTRELLEATERLNLEDIKKAVSRPDNRLRAPVTDVTAAGFLPSREKPGVAKELDPEWQVSVQKDARFPQFGYVQIDDVTGGRNLWSKSPKTLREEGYNVPDSLFDNVPHGKYKLGDILDGEPKDIRKAQPQFQPVTTKTEKQAKGNDEVRRIAADYVREAGLPFAPHSGNQEINEPLAKRIASFYDGAKHEPTDPEVKKSYDAFVQETKDQYRHLTSEGYKLEPWTEKGQPYKNSAEMSADVRDNKHVWYFPTEGGFGTTEVATHPLLDNSGVKIGNKDVPVNDLFRAVHDVFGHSSEGYEFGPRGELNAFRAHAAMYSEEARPAMAAETLGQNSWVNFGEHLRDGSGNIAKKGEKGFVPLTERPFAEQKATTLPKGMIDAVMHPEEGIQFQPSRDPRAIKQAAIKADDGSIFEGPMHLFAHEAAARANHEGPFTDGFVTNNGEFLNRNEAFKRAEELGQYHSLMGETELESNSFTGQQRRREAGFDEGTDPLSLQFQPRGKAKIKDEDILPLTHYTGTSGLKELDPEFHGTGYPGAERKRAQNYSKIYQKRTYFGMPGYEKEPGLGNNRYGAKVPKTSLYDFQGDPDNLYPTTSEIEKAGYAPMDSGAKVTLYEKRIKDAGYKGYFNKEAKAVAMFDKTPVESEGVQFMPSRKPEIRLKDTDKGKHPEEAGFGNFFLSPEGLFFSASDHAEWARQRVSIDPDYLKERASTMFGPGKLTDGRAGRVAEEHLKENGWIRISREREGSGDAVFLNGSRISPKQESALEVWSKENPDVEIVDTHRLLSKPLGRDRFGGSNNSEEQFLPSRNRIEDQLELGKAPPPVDRYDRAYVNSLTPKEKRQLWPEAIHGKEGPLRSEIADSPRYKEAAKSWEAQRDGLDPHQAAVESFANELVKKYNEHGRTPEAESGQEWYSEIAPRLNKFFGEDAPIFAELLAATSPQTNPAQNFRMALEAYKLYKAGWYDENIAKFEEGMRKSQDGTLLRDYKRNIPENKRPDNIGTGTLMQYWIEKHDLKPTKAPKLDKGELKQPLYSMSSEAVLKVLARRWLEQNGGPKTANFVKNLLGTGTGATIDLWADRTMREAGYKGYVKNWRILPENGAGVTDKDFHFSQEAFASAADKLGIKPNELQGAMWFIEKKLWAENGWSPLDLGDYRPHLAELADSGKTVKDIMADVPVTRERAIKNAEIQAKQIKAEAKEREKAQKVLNAEIQALKKKQIAFDFLPKRGNTEIKFMTDEQQRIERSRAEAQANIDREQRRFEAAWTAAHKVADYYLPSLSGKIQTLYRKTSQGGLEFFSNDFVKWRGSNERNPDEFIRERLIPLTKENSNESS